MKIAIDEAAWSGDARAKPSEEATGPVQAFIKTADSYRFMLPGRSEVIEVKIVDGNIDLQTDRSASHRALASALGINV